jgi:hypothetical protein
MRKYKGLLLVLAIVAALGLVTMAYAAGGKNKAGKAGKTPPPPPPVELTASVTKVEGGKVTVSLELPTESWTSVSINGESGKAVTDLKPGQNVKVTFSGKWASRIEVTP